MTNRKKISALCKLYLKESNNPRRIIKCKHKNREFKSMLRENENNVRVIDYKNFIEEAKTQLSEEYIVNNMSDCLKLELDFETNFENDELSPGYDIAGDYSALITVYFMLDIAGREILFCCVGATMGELNYTKHGITPPPLQVDFEDDVEYCPTRGFLIRLPSGEILSDKEKFDKIGRAIVKRYFKFTPNLKNAIAKYINKECYDDLVEYAEESLPALGDGYTSYDYYHPGVSNSDF